MTLRCHEPPPGTFHLPRMALLCPHDNSVRQMPFESRFMDEESEPRLVQRWAQGSEFWKCPRQGLSPGNLVPLWGLRYPTTSGSKDEMAPLASIRLGRGRGSWHCWGSRPRCGLRQSSQPASSPSRWDDGQDASSCPWRERMTNGLKPGCSSLVDSLIWGGLFEACLALAPRPAPLTRLTHLVPSHIHWPRLCVGPLGQSQGQVPRDTSRAPKKLTRHLGTRRGWLSG